MSETTLTWISTVILFLLVIVPYALIVRRKSKKHEIKKNEAISRGQGNPIAQHPRIDESRCIGCGACVIACPETALGLIDGIAELVHPAKCVGHGVCAEACPVSGIKIVLDPARSTAELPVLDDNYQSNQPHIYLVGELGGMALIRNAIFQGKHAIDTIVATTVEKNRDPDVYDVVIAGAGPAGLSAALRAMEHNLKFVVLEKEDSPGGAILSYPRQKLIMTVPVEIPKYGWMKKKEVSKEELLDLWTEIIKETGLEVQCGQKIENISSDGGTLVVESSTGKRYRAKDVVLAIGRRGSPRKLGVPGEQSAKVAYQLMDAKKYEQCHVMVVGAGDSGVEAAIGLSKQAGTTVTVINRGDSFARAKPKNQERILEAEKEKRITVIYNSAVSEITPNEVVVETPDGAKKIPNDFIFVFAGGELPTALLQKIGIGFIQKEKVL
jgi:thioredoxin reductase (NADPH)